MLSSISLHKPTSLARAHTTAVRKLETDHDDVDLPPSKIFAGKNMIICMCTSQDQGIAIKAPHPWRFNATSS